MNILINLPDTLYVMRMPPRQDIVTMHTEFNIYFENIIYPYNKNWDVLVNCKYGKNFGNCWRLNDYNENDSDFDFEIVIYNECGEKLISKKSKIVVSDRTENNYAKIMFIGDSMTHAQEYINHIVSCLYGIQTIGTRSIDGMIKQEGRGGWCYNQYLTGFCEQPGASPFLFPKGVDANDYYGDKDFADKILDNTAPTYSYYGFDYNPISDGQYFVRKGVLFRKNNDNEEMVSERPEFEFSFEKYIKKNNLDMPDMVSLFMGANDLSCVGCSYNEINDKIKDLVMHTQTVIDSIHDCSNKIKVIINLPIICGEQHAWGNQFGCNGSAKMYRYAISHAAKKILDKFDNAQRNNIFISPMLLCIDPINGFQMGFEKVNRYCEKSEKYHSDCIHPNNSGYCQIGDALACVIEYIR